MSQRPGGLVSRSHLVAPPGTAAAAQEAQLWELELGVHTSSSLGGTPSSVLPMRMTMSVVRNRKSGWSAMS